MHLYNGKRAIGTNTTRVIINGKEGIGCYPWMGGAIQALDPFQKRQIFEASQLNQWI